MKKQSPDSPRDKRLFRPSGCILFQRLCYVPAYSSLYWTWDLLTREKRPVTTIAQDSAYLHVSVQQNAALCLSSPLRTAASQSESRKCHPAGKTNTMGEGPRAPALRATSLALAPLHFSPSPTENVTQAARQVLYSAVLQHLTAHAFSSKYFCKYVPRNNFAEYQLLLNIVLTFNTYL